MIITMYELLGLVKDDKAPKKIKYDGIEWEYTVGNQYRRLDKENLGNIWNGYNFNILNDEVEILEEEKKIPKKLDHLIGYDIQQFDDLKEYVEITTNDLFGKINKVIDTLNNVIDYLKSKGE